MKNVNRRDLLELAGAVLLTIPVCLNAVQHRKLKRGTEAFLICWLFD